MLHYSTKNSISFDMLKTMNSEALKDLGIPTVDRKTIMEALNEADEYTIKVVVIGPPSTGKTSLVGRYVEGKFSRNYKSTIGVDFLSKQTKWQDNLVNLQLWDFSGQDRFLSVVPQFYRHALGALVVFDVSQPKTLEAALRWKEHIDKHAPDVPALLIGNKCDLEHSEMNLQEICNNYKFDKSFVTSAQANIGINEAIDHLLNIIFSKPMRSNSVGNIVELNATGKKSTCCGE